MVKMVTKWLKWLKMVNNNFNHSGLKWLKSLGCIELLGVAARSPQGCRISISIRMNALWSLVAVVLPGRMPFWATTYLYPKGKVPIGAQIQIPCSELHMCSGGKESL